MISLFYPLLPIGDVKTRGLKTTQVGIIYVLKWSISVNTGTKSKSEKESSVERNFYRPY